MENRCVILEVVHKPLKLSQMDELYYLDGDDKQDDDTRDKIPIRSTEQLREQMERGVGTEGHSFCMKYIFYAPAGAI
eukprot:1381227-Amorphochlora_amoeboformis.AAC.1